jgi:DNA-binding CsgD family transcriptional regulator
MATLGGGLRSGIALHRAKSRGAFGDHECRGLATIAPHMGAALRLSVRHRQLLDEAWWAGLNIRSGEAALLLDAQGAIIHLTSAAEALAAAGDAVTIRGNRLHPADPSSEGEMRKVLDQATADNRPRAGAAILTRSTSARSVYLLAHPLPRSHRHRAPLAAAALVRIVDPGRHLAGLSTEQRDLFGLTDREAKCAELLLAGHTLETLAQVLSISRNTARNHLHSLFRKTRTNRQADLLRLLMSIG